MTTQLRATILGIVVGIFSGIGTLITLWAILFASATRPPLHELLPFLGWLLVPGMVISGLAICLPMSKAYKKAITLGLVLPAIASCLFVFLG